MPHQTLDEFITAADAVGEVRFVEGASWDLEVGCLAELSSEVEGPLLLFDAFEGFPRGYRVCTNSVRTPRRFALALDFPLDTHPVDLVRLWRERRQRFQPLAPMVVDDGPVLECQQDGSAVDLTCFPVPRWHEHDGGRYLGTGDLVVLRDPDGGWVNVGVYRACLQGPDRLSLWIIHTKHGRILAERHWRQGRAAPVALVLGCDPVTWSCGYLAPPFGVSEYDYAGALHGRPLPVIELPATGLPVPARPRSSSRARSRPRTRSPSTRAPSASGPATMPTRATSAWCGCGACTIAARRSSSASRPSAPSAPPPPSASRRSRCSSGSTWSAAASPTSPACGRSATP